MAAKKKPASKKKNWIKGAIKKPGALRATAKRAGALKADGDIKKSWLRKREDCTTCKVSFNIR